MPYEITNIMGQELSNIGSFMWFNLTNYVACVFRLFKKFELKVISTKSSLDTFGRGPEICQRERARECAILS